MAAVVAKGRTSGGGGAAGYALRVLAVMLGVFLILSGVAKLAWFTDSTILSRQLEEWRQRAAPGARWYIETVASPGVPLFARLVPLVELVTGVALVLGFWIRLAAALAFLLVANFLLAQGFFYEWQVLADGAGLPLLGGLLALMIGGARLPLSVSRQ